MAVELDAAESKIEDLKAQLDVAGEAQDMLEELTERNMKLHDVRVLVTLVTAHESDGVSSRTTKSSKRMSRSSKHCASSPTSSRKVTLRQKSSCKKSSVRCPLLHVRVRLASNEHAIRRRQGPATAGVASPQRLARRQLRRLRGHDRTVPRACHQPAGVRRISQAFDSVACLTPNLHSQRS